jgi:hypothetical protein
MATVATVLWDTHGVILLQRLVLLSNTARQLDLTVSVCLSVVKRTSDFDVLLTVQLSIILVITNLTL